MWIFHAMHYIAFYTYGDYSHEVFRAGRNVHFSGLRDLWLYVAAERIASKPNTIPYPIPECLICARDCRSRVRVLFPGLANGVAAAPR